MSLLLQRFLHTFLSFLLLIILGSCVHTRPVENQQIIREIVSRANADFYLDERIWYQDVQAEIGVCFEEKNLYEEMSASENLRFYAALFGIRSFDPLPLLGRVGLPAV